MPDSRSLVHRLFEVVPTGTAILDRDLRYVHVNPAFAAINGKSVEEHLGRTVAEVLPHLAHVIEPVVRRVLDKGEPFLDIEIPTDDDELGLRWWSVSYQPLREEDVIVAAAVTVVDITDRRAAADALRKNEALFRVICETAPVGIFLTDPSGNSLYTNPTNLAQMGMTAAETQGRGWARAIHPDDVERVCSAFDHAIRTGTVYSGEYRYVRRDGTVVWVDVTARAVVVGETRAHLGITQDITERRNAEDALKRTELQFRQLADNIDSVLWLVDCSRRLLYVSPAYTAVAGAPPPAAFEASHPFLDLVHGDDRGALDELLACPLGEARSVEYRILRADGSVACIADRAFPVRDETGRVVRVAGIATDVTRQRLLEAQAREAQKLDSIGRLAGGVAHDFNNLLTVILTQASLARRARGGFGVPPTSFEAEKNADEQLAQIEEAAGHAAELTRRLLTFARRSVSQPSLIDPSDLLRGLSQLLRRVIGENIRLVTLVSPEVGIVRADWTQLEQVLVNLVINARDAMPDGGTITVEATNAEAGPHRAANEAWVVIRVRDEGRGISERDRPHLFEPFFSTKPAGEGTGLGLATSYGIVKQHGGEIVVESTVGRGSIFSVYLPSIEGEPDAVAPPRSSRSGPPASLSERPSSETVLFVEDDARVREAGVQALREHGFQVLAAADGAEAIRVAERHGHRVDIVVTDVVMPTVGGRELAAKLKRARPRLPILFTSGYESGEILAPFLAKPYVPASLVASVRQVLDGV